MTLVWTPKPGPTYALSCSWKSGTAFRDFTAKKSAALLLPDLDNAQHVMERDMQVSGDEIADVVLKQFASWVCAFDLPIYIVRHLKISRVSRQYTQKRSSLDVLIRKDKFLNKTC